AVVGQRGGSHRIPRVRRVRALRNLLRGDPQRLPVHRRLVPRLVSHRVLLAQRSHLMYGWPIAAGGRCRPTRPATATIVTRYGTISMNWLGIGVPMIDR